MIQVVIFDFFGVIYNPKTGDVTEGLKDFMAQLDHKKLRCGIASSSNSRHIQEFIDLASIATQFEVVVGAHEVQSTKPNPECYIKVADFFNVTPEQCLVIDDSASAISAAKHVGFYTVLFGNDVHNFQSIEIDIA